jgi:hypothetical protein
MREITAYRDAGEVWFVEWHGKNLDDKSEVFEAEVTTQDFEMMMNPVSDYYKDKVHKLIDQRPFDRWELNLQDLKERIWKQ